MSQPVKLAVVGVGRIGRYHARHIQELGRESADRGDRACELVAVADHGGDTAARVAAALQPDQEQEIQTFAGAADLASAGVAEAAVIASSTESHAADARLLIDAGMRVLLEKPLTDSLEHARELVGYLEADQSRRQALMLAFMRRFDEPLQWVKQTIEGGRIGRPFKMVTCLEDNMPPPAGYDSPGILTDMGVHLTDESMWLMDARPESVKSFGSLTYSHRISAVNEDYDDAFLQMWFADGQIAQLQVSRNHVAGYRNEVWVYGEEGMVHGGLFAEDPLSVRVEAFAPSGLIERKTYTMPDNGSDAPFFIQRFGPAYKRDVEHFVGQCRNGQPFSVDQLDGLRAMEVVAAGTVAISAPSEAVSVDYLP